MVFIDYQNLWHSAREAFGDPESDPPTFGHVHPQRLGVLLTQLGADVDPARELTGVRVYRGQPGPKSHRNLVAAFDRQVAVWRARPMVTVITRPLRYWPVAWTNSRPSQWRAEEKGIDVLIALDIAIGARDDAYGTGIVVSADTDLAPAVETAVAAGKRIETATWYRPGRPGLHRPLQVPGRRLWNHRLDLQRFDMVRDDTNYLHRT